MKTSKVKTVGFLQSFEYNNETYYSHRYAMEDGTEIIANHKKMNPIAVGAEVEYEVKGNDKLGNPKGNVKEIKEVMPGTFHGGGGNSYKYQDNSDAILMQTSLKAVTEMYVATEDSKKGICDAQSLVNAAFDIAKASKLKIKELKTI